MGESKSICDSIRSKAKVKLQEKFLRLKEKEQCFRSLVPTDNHRRAEENEGGVREARATVVGNVNLSSDALSALDLGPSFAPRSVCPLA